MTLLSATSIGFLLKWGGANARPPTNGFKTSSSRPLCRRREFLYRPVQLAPAACKSPRAERHSGRRWRAAGSGLWCTAAAAMQRIRGQPQQQQQSLRLEGTPAAAAAAAADPAASAAIAVVIAVAAETSVIASFSIKKLSSLEQCS